MKPEHVRLHLYPLIVLLPCILILTTVNFLLPNTSTPARFMFTVLVSVSIAFGIFYKGGDRMKVLVIAVAAFVTWLSALFIDTTVDNVKSYECTSAGVTYMSPDTKVDRIEPFSNTGCLFYTGHTSGFAYDPEGQIRDAGVYVFSDPDYSGIQKFHLDPLK